MTEYSSPPCYAHEIDPAYFGELAGDELIALLNTLLEGERAVVRIAQRSRRAAASLADAAVLDGLGMDAQKDADRLAEAIARLGGAPSDGVGRFFDAAKAIPDLDRRLYYLRRCRGRLARRLADVKARIADDGARQLVADLIEAHGRAAHRPD